MIYVASPYSDPDPAVRQQRYEAACAVTASMLRAGETVFSPIVHCHPLVAYGLPTDWAFWQRVDGDHVLFCDEVVVLMFDGWDRSVGVRDEIRLARELGKPVRFVIPMEPTTHASIDARVARQNPVVANEVYNWPSTSNRCAGIIHVPLSCSPSIDNSPEYRTT